MKKLIDKFDTFQIEEKDFHELKDNVASIVSKIEANLLELDKLKLH